MAEWQNPQTIAIWLGIIIFVVLALISAIILFSRVYYKRILEEQNKLTDAKIRYQKKLLNDSILVQERERNRIAADLHDDLISKLHVLKLSHFANKPASLIEEMMDNSINTARRISHDLSPPLVEQVSLEELIIDFTGSLNNSLEVVFHKQNIPCKEIPLESKLQIFRIIQEVVNNIIKYAEAKQIYVNLHINKKGLSLMVKDDGVGFDVAKKGKGLGMKNIELRTQVLNAKYRFKSGPNKGTTFLLCLNEIQKTERNAKNKFSNCR